MDKHRPNANLYEYRGESLTLTELSKISGLDRNVLYARLRRGTDIETAMTQKKISSARKNKKSANLRLDPAIKKEKPPVIIIDDADIDDLAISDSWIKSRISEEQRNRRNDYYERQVQKEVEGIDFY